MVLVVAFFSRRWHHGHHASGIDLGYSHVLEGFKSDELGKGYASMFLLRRALIPLLFGLRIDWLYSLQTSFVFTCATVVVWTVPATERLTQKLFRLPYLDIKSRSQNQ